ncbi:unnamed protein product, partial [Hydatigera taeniaeformis]|uniref:DUF5734 domain-containing protein n=1 Tax=Hydatigena taeniaeformis TaxID=6205 RepID=A0A0R3WK96_HYDTA
MTEYTLTHLRVGKYKKETKMDAQMTKELQKAAKAKPVEEVVKIEPTVIKFKHHAEEIDRSKIAKMQRNKNFK